MTSIYTIYVVSAIFFVLAFWAKTNMDWSGAGKFKGVEAYKNRNSYSSDNKYAYPIQPYVKKWYYFGLITPEHKENFPYSTTIFVFLTDYWHKQQFIFLNCYTFATCLLVGNYAYEKMIAFVTLQVLSHLSFNAGYERRK